ncbi:MAG TPA: hypothetical protein ENJ20_03715 [Bacteroidetes bacterium]|nr:hypothetical protein [Bacteroidota bacterium]
MSKSFCQCCFSALLLIGPLLLPAQSLPTINAAFQNTPLEAVFTRLEATYAVSFSYEDETIAGITINTDIRGLPLDKAVGKLLEGTPLGFEIVDDRFVLIKKIKDPRRSSPTLPLSAICGQVFDKTTRQSLPGATAYVHNTPHGTTTDTEGRFRLEGHFKKTDTLEIRFLGYQPVRLAVQPLLDKPCTTFYLGLACNRMPDILISDFAIDLLTPGKGGNFHFKKEKMPTLPGWGEPDVMRMLQLLPGIGSAEGNASRLNVRGGTPDQNLILWEGIPIYHSGHLFGLYDAFNPYVVKDVDVWRGNFDAKYGGRNSSVIDIKGRPNLVDETTWGVGFNLLHLNAFMEKPLFRKSKTKKGALLLALRTSTIDRIDNKIYKELFRQVFKNSRITLERQERDEEGFVTWNPVFSYGDFNFKLRWQGKHHNDNAISFYGSTDELFYRFAYDDGEDFYETIDLVNTGNIGLSWQHRADWSPVLKAKYTFAYSNFHNAYTFRWNEQDRERPFAYRYQTDNTMADLSARLHHQWQVSDRHRMSFGYNFSAQEAWLVYRDTDAITTRANIWEQDTTRNLLHTFYATFDYDVTDKLNLSLGIRENHLPQRNLYYSEPRISFSWRPLWEGFSVNGGMGRYWQFVFQILDFGDLGIGEPLWYITSEDLPAQELWQWTLGLRHEKKSLLIDLEFYHKNSRNLTSLNLRVDKGFDRPWSFDGMATASGMDLLIRKRIPPYSLWFAYSIGKVYQQFPELNNGLPYPARHDIRHQFNWVNMLSLGKWNLSANLHFHTGTPFSIPTVVRVECPDCTADSTTFSLAFNQLNNTRLPHSVRLDVSATYSFGKKNRKWKTGLSFFNLLNRKNLLGKDFLLNTPSFDQPQTSFNLQKLNRLDSGIAPNFFLHYQW